MGSFIITLKTINRARIYTRSRDPAPEQGSNPHHSRHRDCQGAATGIAAGALASPQQLPAAKGSSGRRVHLNPRPQCRFIIGTLLQQGFQCEVCKELITGTT